MKYMMYTDGACMADKNKMSIGYLIRTKDTYITMGANIFDGNNISRAETLGIAIAIEVLEDFEKQGLIPDITEEDTVVIYTDCKSARDFLRGDKGFDNRNKYNEKIKCALQIYEEFSKRCNLKVQLIDSHRDSNNGNKVADRMAKLALRKAVEV